MDSYVADMKWLGAVWPETIALMGGSADCLMTCEMSWQPINLSTGLVHTPTNPSPIVSEQKESKLLFFCN